MRVRDVMTPDPVTVGPDTPVEAIATLLRERDIRHVPVVQHGRLCGVISVKDLARGGVTTASIMTAVAVTVSSEEALEVAATTMALRKVSSLLVVDQGRLVGIVTTYDLLDALARNLRAMRTPREPSPR